MSNPSLSPYLDFLNLDASLSGDEQMAIKAIRHFVSTELEPLVKEAYRHENFPKAVVPRMGQMGLLGSFLKTHGSPGVNALTYGLSMRELERCDSSFRSFASVQGGLVMYPISEFGDDAQKNAWLPKLSGGEAIGCFALSESEGGSDPGAMKTTALKQADHWLMNGSKMWITNGNLADIAVVWAKTNEGIRGFLVPSQTPGFKAVPMRHKLSLRASMTSELFFDQMKLPLNAILPGALGLKTAFQCLNQARYGILWGVLGAAEACFAEALAHVSQRVVFSKPLASFQLVQRKLAIMATQISQGQLLAKRLAELKTTKALHHSQISMGKQSNVEMALNVARSARDLLGAHGIMDEYATMRHLCNLETVYTYEGTNDIHLLVVGQQLTQIPAFG